MQHLIDVSLFKELNEDTKINNKENFKNIIDLDIEVASDYQNSLF